MHEVTAIQAKLTHALEQLQAERGQTARLTESLSVLRSELEHSKNSVLKLTQEVRALDKKENILNAHSLTIWRRACSETSCAFRSCGSRRT